MRDHLDVYKKHHFLQEDHVIISCKTMFFDNITIKLQTLSYTMYKYLGSSLYLWEQDCRPPKILSLMYPF